MREYVEGPRRSGRTYNFVMALPTPLDENEILFVVAHSFSAAVQIKKLARELRGDKIADSIRPIGLLSLDTLRGKDPMSVFFEHTAYEQASARQYRDICAIEDLQDSIWSMM